MPQTALDEWEAQRREEAETSPLAAWERSRGMLPEQPAAPEPVAPAPAGPPPLMPGAMEAGPVPFAEGRLPGERPPYEEIPRRGALETMGRFARALPTIIGTGIEKIPEVAAEMADPQRKSPIARTIGTMLGKAGKTVGTLAIPGMLPTVLGAGAMEKLGVTAQRPEIRKMSGGERAKALATEAVQLAGFKYLPRLGTIGKVAAGALIAGPAGKEAKDLVEQADKEGWSPAELGHALARGPVADVVGFVAAGKVSKAAAKLKKPPMVAKTVAERRPGPVRAKDIAEAVARGERPPTKLPVTKRVEWRQGPAQPERIVGMRTRRREAIVEKALPGVLQPEVGKIRARKAKAAKQVDLMRQKLLKRGIEPPEGASVERLAKMVKGLPPKPSEAMRERARPKRPPREPRPPIEKIAPGLAAAFPGKPEAAPRVSKPGRKPWAEVAGRQGPPARKARPLKGIIPPGLAEEPRGEPLFKPRAKPATAAPARRMAPPKVAEPPKAGQVVRSEGKTVHVPPKFRQSVNSKAAKERVVEVDVKRFDPAWKADDPQLHLGRGKGWQPGRKEATQKFLEEMPRVAIGPTGKPSFVDGRHRFAILRDAGVKTIPVSVSAKQAAQLQKQWGTAKAPGPKPGAMKRAPEKFPAVPSKPTRAQEVKVLDKLQIIADRWAKGDVRPKDRVFVKSAQGKSKPATDIRGAADAIMELEPTAAELTPETLTPTGKPSKRIAQLMGGRAVVPGQAMAGVLKLASIRKRAAARLGKKIAAEKAVAGAAAAAPKAAGQPMRPEALPPGTTLTKPLRRDVEKVIGDFIDRKVFGGLTKLTAPLRRLAAKAERKRVGEPLEKQVERLPGGKELLTRQKKGETAIWNLRRKAQGFIADAASELKDPKLSADLYRAIEHQQALPAGLSQRAIALVGRGLDTIDKYGQELVKHGAMTKESYDKWKGGYIVRRYEDHIPPEGLKRITEWGKRVMGKRAALSKEEAAHLKQRKFATTEEAEAAGLKPIRDTAMSLGLGVIEEGTSVQKMRLFDYIAKQPVTQALTRAAPTELGKGGRRYIPGPEADPQGFRLLKSPGGQDVASRRKYWGALADRRVDPTVARHLEGVMEATPQAMGPVFRAIQKVAGWQRRRVTIWNPVAQMNQLFYNFGSLDMSGIDPVQHPKFLLDVAKDIATDGPWSKQYKANSRLVDADIFGSTQRMAGLKGVRNAQGLYETLLKESSIAGKPSGVTKVGRLAERAWRTNDQFFIMAKWVAERLKGKSIAAADKAVSETYPLPKDVPDFVNRLDKDVFGMPFVRMQYQSAKTTLGQMSKTEGALRALKWFAYYKGFKTLALKHHGIKEEEWDKMTEAAYGSPISLPVGMNKDRGWMMDLAYKVPGGDLVPALFALGEMKPKEAMKHVASESGQRLFSHPVLSIIATLVTGTKPFTESRIWEKEEAKGRKVAKGAMFAAGQMLPPSIERTGMAAFRKATGRKRYKKERHPGWPGVLQRGILSARPTPTPGAARRLLKEREERRKKAGKRPLIP